MPFLVKNRVLVLSMSLAINDKIMAISKYTIKTIDFSFLELLLLLCPLFLQNMN